MRYVIIGQKGSSELLVVDTELMTVTPLDRQTVVPDDIRASMANGNAMVDGIDIAVTADQRQAGSSAWFYQSSREASGEDNAITDGIDIAVAAGPRDAGSAAWLYQNR